MFTPNTAKMVSTVAVNTHHPSAFSHQHHFLSENTCINHLNDWICALCSTNSLVNPNPQRTLLLFTSRWIFPLISTRFSSRGSVPFTYQRAGGLEYPSSLYATRDELHCISPIIPCACYEEPVESGHDEGEISLPYQGTQTNKLFPHPSYRHYSHGRFCQWKEWKDANDTDTFNC